MIFDLVVEGSNSRRVSTKRDMRAAQHLGRPGRHHEIYFFYGRGVQALLLF